MKAKVIGMVAAILLLAAGMAQAAITIKTVPVGNAGNAADTRYATPGYGAVSYEYNIGKYEVTAGQYCEFLNAVANKTDTYGLYNTEMSDTSYGSGIARAGSAGSYAYSVDSAFTNRPVNFVSWGDSVRFANWLTNGQGSGSTETGAYNLNGATTDDQLMAVVVPTATQRKTWSTGAKSYFLLTSEDEWYKAAYHDKNAVLAATYFDYPTSTNSEPGRDMTEATNSGNNANYYDVPYPIDSGKYTTLVGEFENSDSPYGTFDQGGNVLEWNEGSLSRWYRNMRGGSFADNLDHYYGYLHASTLGLGYPTYEGRYVGFRVSVVPEPATLSLLALLALSLPKRGGLAMLRRRQRMA